MIDYTKYTDAQLFECLSGIDATSYSENYQRLISEIRGRGLDKKKNTHSKPKHEITPSTDEELSHKAEKRAWSYPDICENQTERVKRFFSKKGLIHLLILISLILATIKHNITNDRIALGILTIYVVIIAIMLKKAMKQTRLIQGTALREGSWIAYHYKNNSFLWFAEFQTDVGPLKIYIPYIYRIDIGAEYMLEVDDSNKLLGYRALKDPDQTKCQLGTETANERN